MQLEDDSRKAATRLIKEVEASLEGLAFFRLIALVYGVVPDLPVSNVREIALC